MTETCNDGNPWDASVRCNKPAGHVDDNPPHNREAHHARMDGNSTYAAWADGAHFNGDACGEGVHPEPDEIE